METFLTTRDLRSTWADYISQKSGSLNANKKVNNNNKPVYKKGGLSTAPVSTSLTYRSSSSSKAVPTLPRPQQVSGWAFPPTCSSTVSA